MIFDVNDELLLPGDTIAFSSKSDREFNEEYAFYSRHSMIKTAHIYKISHEIDGVKVYVHVETPEEYCGRISILKDTNNILRIEKGDKHEELEE